MQDFGLVCERGTVHRARGWGGMVAGGWATICNATPPPQRVLAFLVPGYESCLRNAKKN